MGIVIDIEKAEVELIIGRSANQAQFLKGRDENNSMQQNTRLQIYGYIEDIFKFKTISIKTDNRIETASEVNIQFLAMNDEVLRYRHNSFVIYNHCFEATCFLDKETFTTLSNAINFDSSIIQLKFMEPVQEEGAFTGTILHKEELYTSQIGDNLVIDLTGKVEYWLDVEAIFVKHSKEYITNQNQINEYLTVNIDELRKSNQVVKQYLWGIVFLLFIILFI